MVLHKKKAFTLVELIVVIVILGILATIAFVSYNGYLSSSRDSVRMADIKNISTSIETFTVKSGSYPEPSGTLTNVTYSGATMYSQGTVGDSFVRTTMMLSKKPSDPLTQKDYRYTVSRNQYKPSYELSSEIEGTIAFDIEENLDPFRNEIAYGATSYNTYLKSSYNGYVIRAYTGSTYYAITSPSISVSDSYATGGTLDVMSLSGKIVYQNQPNTGISFTPQVVWTGSSLILTKVQPFIDSVQTSFTPLASASKYTTLTTATGSTETNLGTEIFTNYIGGSINETYFTINPTSIVKGQTATISDNCSIHPSSYTISGFAGAQISGNVISISPSSSFSTAQTVTVTAVGGSCGDNGPKTITLNPSVFTLSKTAIKKGETVDITGNCTNATYTSSNTSLAVINGNTITGTGFFTTTGTVNITSSGCSNDTSISLTLNPSSFFLSSYSISSPGSVTITSNCHSAPTNFSGINSSIATLSYPTISATKGGTLSIAPLDGDCSDVSPKTLSICANSNPGDPAVACNFCGGVQPQIGWTCDGGMFVGTGALGDPNKWLISTMTTYNATWNNGTTNYSYGSASSYTDGLTNTNTAVSTNLGGTPNAAAKLCYDLVLNNKSDWYLPASNELNLLFTDAYYTLGTDQNEHWSSTELNSTQANSVKRGYGGAYANAYPKGQTLRVRCTRVWN